MDPNLNLPPPGDVAAKTIAANILTSVTSEKPLEQRKESLKILGEATAAPALNLDLAATEAESSEAKCEERKTVKRLDPEYKDNELGNLDFQQREEPPVQKKVQDSERKHPAQENRECSNSALLHELKQEGKEKREPPPRSTASSSLPVGAPDERLSKELAGEVLIEDEEFEVVDSDGEDNAMNVSNRLAAANANGSKQREEQDVVEVIDSFEVVDECIDETAGNHGASGPVGAVTCRPSVRSSQRSQQLHHQDLHQSLRRSVSRESRGSRHSTTHGHFPRERSRTGSKSSSQRAMSHPQQRGAPSSKSPVLEERPHPTVEKEVVHFQTVASSFQQQSCVKPSSDASTSVQAKTVDNTEPIDLSTNKSNGTAADVDILDLTVDDVSLNFDTVEDTVKTSAAESESNTTKGASPATSGRAAATSQTGDKDQQISERATVPDKQGTSADAKGKQSIAPKRTKPVKEVEDYVNALIHVDLDLQKYSCFFCRSCRKFFPSAVSWNSHLEVPAHKRGVVCWRLCRELHQDTLVKSSSNQKEIESFPEPIIGANYGVELRDENGTSHHWVCLLCNESAVNMRDFLTHLSSLMHTAFFLELAKELPNPWRYYDDETLSDERRQELKRKLTEPVATLIKKYGRGIMKSYTGEKYKNWLDDGGGEYRQKEESMIAQQMDNFFNKTTEYEERVLKYEKIPSCSSIACAQYDTLPKSRKDTIIGFQYIVELRPPAQSQPAYYCILCKYMTTSWEMHCSIIRHCIAYFMRHYRSIYNCITLEVDNEHGMRKQLTIAKEKVLQLEGYRAKLHTVVLLKTDSEDSFLALNSKTVKRIIKKLEIEIPKPPRARPKTFKLPKKSIADYRSLKSTEKFAKKASSSSKVPHYGFGVGDQKPSLVSSKPIKRESYHSRDVRPVRETILSQRYEEYRREQLRRLQMRAAMGKERMAALQAAANRHVALAPPSFSRKAAAAVLQKYREKEKEKYLRRKLMERRLAASSSHRHYSERHSSSYLHRTPPPRPPYSPRHCLVEKGQSMAGQSYRMNYDADMRSSMMHNHAGRSAVGSSKRSARGEPPPYGAPIGHDSRLTEESFASRKRRRQDDREGPTYYNQVRMTGEALVVLTDMLRNVGVDLGRRLTVDDLDMVRWRLGGDVVDELLSRVNVFGTDGNEEMTRQDFMQKERPRFKYDRPVALMGDSDRYSGYRETVSAATRYGMPLGEPVPLLPEMSDHRTSRALSYEQQPRGSDGRHYDGNGDYDYREKSSAFAKRSHSRTGFSGAKTASPTMIPRPIEERPYTGYMMRGGYEAVGRFSSSRPEGHRSDTRMDGASSSYGNAAATQWRDSCQSYAREERSYERPDVAQKMRQNETKTYWGRSAMFPGSSRYGGSSETAQGSRW